jgi:hypothetical protein
MADHPSRSDVTRTLNSQHSHVIRQAIHTAHAHPGAAWAQRDVLRAVRVAQGTCSNGIIPCGCMLSVDVYVCVNVCGYVFCVCVCVCVCTLILLPFSSLSIFVCVWTAAWYDDVVKFGVPLLTDHAGSLDERESEY